MCAVATLKTTHIGRRYRGRLFLGGTLTETDLSEGLWIDPHLSLWQALLNAVPRQPDLILGAGAGSCDWVVYSRTQRQQLKDPYASKIVSATVSATPHWLRSRQN
jgi:hypothetical protein